MNRTNVRIVLIFCLIAAAVSWLVGCALYYQRTPAEESLRLQFLALYDYHQTNHFTLERKQMMKIAVSGVTNDDLETQRAATSLLVSLNKADSDDTDAEQDLLHQSYAIADARHLKQSKFTHVA